MTLGPMDGELFAAFTRIRIGSPLMNEVHTLFDNLRSIARDRAGGPLPWAGVFGPPLTGKTVCATSYIETKVVEELIQEGKFAADIGRAEIARQQRRVLPVVASPEATHRSFLIDILEALGDPRSTRGATAQELLTRACECLQRHGTELLIFLEAQHLFDRRPSMASSHRAETAITKTVMTLLRKEVVPVVLVGNLEAQYAPMDNEELAARCLEKLKSGPLDRADEVQWETFVNFVGTLGVRLKQHGLFDEPFNFLSRDIDCIYEVANGRLGIASALVCRACMTARRAGAVRVEREHLSAAIDSWAIPLGIIDHNPSRDEVRRSVHGEENLRRKRLRKSGRRLALVGGRNAH